MHPSDHADVALLGGGVAAARCARTLRRSGFDGSILLLTDEPMLPYNRPPLSKELLRDDLPDDLVLAEPESWYQRRNVEVALGRRVLELDAGERTLALDDDRVVSFGRCLIATGAEPRRLPVPGGDGVMLLRTLADARRLRDAAIQSVRGAPVSVVGGGFIGVELASSLAALGLRPTILEMGQTLWAGSLGDELAAWATERLVEAGIGVRLGKAVSSVEPGGVRLASGARLEHAFAVAGIGVQPRVTLAERAGLELDDGIVTDAEQRTSADGIWAAGDVARVAGRRVEHWHAAREGGERAALSMLGMPVPAPRASWVFTEVAGITLDVIGDATAWDEARWLRGDRVLAYLAGDSVVQLAIVDSAIDPGTARELVERGASVHDLALG